MNHGNTPIEEDMPLTPTNIIIEEDEPLAPTNTIIEEEEPVAPTNIIIEEDEPVARTFDTKDIVDYIKHATIWANYYNHIVSLVPKTAISALHTDFTSIQMSWPGFQPILTSNSGINLLKDICASGNQENIKNFLTSASVPTAKMQLLSSGTDHAIVQIHPQGLYIMSVFLINKQEEYFLIINDDKVAHLHEFVELIRNNHSIIASDSAEYSHHHIISNGVIIPAHSLSKEADIAAKACFSAIHPDATTMTTQNFVELCNSDEEHNFTIDDINVELLAQESSVFGAI